MYGSHLRLFEIQFMMSSNKIKYTSFYISLLTFHLKCKIIMGEKKVFSWSTCKFMEPFGLIPYHATPFLMAHWHNHSDNWPTTNASGCLKKWNMKRSTTSCSLSELVADHYAWGSQTATEKPIKSYLISASRLTLLCRSTEPLYHEHCTVCRDTRVCHSCRHRGLLWVALNLNISQVIGGFQP